MGKLVCDKIPGIIDAAAEERIVRVADDKEYAATLPLWPTSPEAQ